ncbi:MAG: DUF3987 domain-containing protein [Alphaproteobacteria bacterium]|nr:DUF3987 domain-containing protein [Alphaproteobacteria bacterium]
MVEKWNGPHSGEVGAADEVWQHSQGSTDISLPANLQDQFDRIPAELKAYRNFVVWRYEHKPNQEKLAKVLYSPHTKRHASSIDPKTWRAFDECVAAFRASKRNPPGKQWDGIGFVFSDNDPYAGVDFDQTDDAELFAYQKQWAERFNSYAEKSPSGKGLHVIVKGSVPKGINSRAHKIEVYSSGRYFTMTGDVYSNAWIADRNDELNALWAELSNSRAMYSEGGTPDEPQTEDDDTVWSRAANAPKNGDKFKQLWAGQWQHVVDSKGQPYSSQSEADFALMETLRFYSRSRSQCARMFRNSELYRREKDADVDRMAAKLGGRPAIPDSVIALGRQMASGEPVQSQDRPWPSTLSQPQGMQPMGAPAVFSQPLAPEPLSRELPPAPPFPVDALGPILSAATRAIVEEVKCPAAIAAQSVLGAAALVVQPHADVVIPATGGARPVSLFLLTIAESGERKSTVDAIAFAAINQHVHDRYAEYKTKKADYDIEKQAHDIARKQVEKTKSATLDEIKSALTSMPGEPVPPSKPALTCSEPTFEGLFKLFEYGSPSLGMYSDEGARFLNSHSMQPENRLAMAGGLNKLWDGSAIDRVRVNETVMLFNRRMSAHLMMQPDISDKMLSDADLKGIGFLGRFLICAPDTKSGTRFLDDNHNFSAKSALAAYNHHITNILKTPLPMAEGGDNELAPRKLHLSPEAKSLWIAFANEVESKLGPNGEYANIKSFANKLPEHALRLAAVIALVELGPNTPNIPAHAFTCGMQLATFYASEALRLWDTAHTNPEIRQAKHLLNWLHERMREGHDTIDLQTIYQFGPRAAQVRDKAGALRPARLLEDHRWLLPLPDRKHRWRVRPPQ